LLDSSFGDRIYRGNNPKIPDLEFPVCSPGNETFRRLAQFGTRRGKPHKAIVDLLGGEMFTPAIAIPKATKQADDSLNETLVLMNTINYRITNN